MDLEIVHEDEDIIVLNKPPGLLSQEDYTGDLDVVRLVRRHLRERGANVNSPYVGLVHRLDRPVSGLMIVALTREAARLLGQQFRERFADKRYLALVEGRCTGLGTCEDYIIKEDQDVRLVPPSHPDGKLAELTWQALDQRGTTSLLLVQLHTGRPHQVRVQLAHRGWPIVGDVRYGATQELDGRNIGLHAYRLAIEHPRTERGMQWAVGPPPTWPDEYEDVITPVISN